MKKVLFALIFAVLTTGVVIGQTPGTPIVIDTTKTVFYSDTVIVKKVKAPDKVYKITPDGIIYYQGSRCGIYTIKTSKKTGKIYKSYIKKENL
jgi:hypothetical protein